ncbi:DUF262 domain-containing protein [Marispirochaeta aestuarii]|uniref:DUF262 domain-containing protein n=1 Tax=Marispirochaeta aestuarii TaxID=1963862 RepID=UPI001301B988|nr:DUF262 domain-containing protein [Marispirochaeta aestuarii]
MAYQEFSVLEVIKKINNVDDQGFFLPYVQRDYVWGTRYQAEERICNLFDSVFKGYPIGSIILWKTNEEIPFHYFIQDLDSDTTRSTNQDNGVHSISKHLVYDGQQRLQTLFSVLRHSFNGKVLAFDLLSDSDVDMDDTGFRFIDRNSPHEPHLLKLNRLFSKDIEKENAFRRELRNEITLDLDEKQEELFEDNFHKLWMAFRTNSLKPLVAWIVDEVKEEKVNQIFMRLNTGGIPLTRAELMLSTLSVGNTDIHDFLKDLTEIIENQSGGYVFDTSELLRFLNQIVKGNLRIDVSQTSKDEQQEILGILDENFEKPVTKFFEQFLKVEFNITSNSLIPQKYALYPLIVYFYKLWNKGNKDYNHLNEPQKMLVKKYFIISQLKAWNLQGDIDQSSRKVIEISDAPSWSGDFPLADVIAIVKAKNKRGTEIEEVDLANNSWFALKIIRKDTVFLFSSTKSGRINPELEHIFPKGLYPDKDYKQEVNILWNLDAISGQINNQKKNKHPKEYFQNNQSFFDHYKFLPDLNSAEWDDHKLFIEKRKERMINEFTRLYDITITK